MNCTPKVLYLTLGVQFVIDGDLLFTKIGFREFYKINGWQHRRFIS